MTHQEIRRSRILAMKKLISDANVSGIGFKTEKLLARLSVDSGVSRRTAQEYLSCLLLTGEVKEINGELWIPEKFLAWKDIDKQKPLKEDEILEDKDEKIMQWHKAQEELIKKEMGG